VASQETDDIKGVTIHIVSAPNQQIHSTKIRELLTPTMSVLPSSGFFVCKCHAVIGADRAA
jgi:hypothetical protein